jgi:tetratricopeptide (TPR) repeat protein
LPDKRELNEPSLQENPHKVVTLLIFALLVGGYAFMAAYYPLAYIWATYEDLIGEWGQTYFFLSATILSVLVAIQRSQYRWFFMVLAVACSYVVLEEISWGQRIFDFSTPDFLKSRNLQGEANLHNLLTGPHKTLLKDFISVGVAIGLLGYGLIYPLTRYRGWRLAHWADKMGVAAPPLVLAPFFVLAAYFELKPFSFNEAEIAELLVAAALAMTALHYLFAIRRGLPATASTWGRNESLVFGRWLIILSTAVVAIAALTTVAFYSAPGNESRINSRIERGIEKFAGRYRRHNRCDIANELYGMLLQKEPQRVYILRQMAVCYQHLEQPTMFDEAVAAAIDIDLKVYTQDPWRASVNQSLVRSYRLAGSDEKARQHLEEALAIGITRIEDHPDSAKAAYSFGRTLQLANRREEAFEQFTRAYEFDRTSSRYRKAYFSARAYLEKHR